MVSALDGPCTVAHMRSRHSTEVDRQLASLVQTASFRTLHLVDRLAETVEFLPLHQRNSARYEVRNVRNRIVATLQPRREQ